MPLWPRWPRGAHAIVGVDMDYKVLGQGNMLMVTASGTAVTVEAA